MNKKAFTMIELVFVIVVIGILTALAVPRLERDLRQEAADNILSAVRYTQHLALLDDKHMFNEGRWQRRFWRIYFGKCEDKTFYVIGSKARDSDSLDDASVNVGMKESALDPSNGRFYWAVNGNNCEGTHDLSEISPNIMIGKKYGIASVSGAGGCSGVQYIGFDHLGRPHIGFSTSTKPDNASYMKNACAFTFTLEEGDDIILKIEPETGYAYIDGQKGI